MFDVAARVSQSLKSTVLVLGRAQRKDNSPPDVVVLGSGVVVAPEVVITSNHINYVSADLYSSLDVFVGSDHTYDPTGDSLYCHPVTTASADGPRDILLMRVPGLPSTPVALRKQDPIPGELLYWIGHPGPDKKQMAPVVASGIVAAKQLVPHFPRGVSTAVRGLRLDGSALGGNSGGGAFDQNGLLCGLICASPLQVSERHLSTLVASQNGGQGLIGGVDVVGVLRGLLEELYSTTRPGIAYAVGVEEIRAALPTLLQRLP
jgi:Trypsin-like peptidase domain